MANKNLIKDVIVILPGIMGSVLQKDGKDLWNFSRQSIWEFAKSSGKRLADLKLQGDDPNSEDLGDGIKATSLISDSYLIPGFWKLVDGYQKTKAIITQNFEVIEGNIYEDPQERAANCYTFPYDWRRDNRTNAKILKKLIDQRLKVWREYSGNQEAKVILIAHSMGGLISRYYLEVLEGWRDSKALFTFGTPYRGSLNAINILANGSKKAGVDLLELLKLKEVIPSLTSIYQLLPRYRVLKVGTEYYRVSQSPVAIPNLDPAKATDALNFHDEIDNAADANYNNIIYQNSFVTCPIVGIQQPTKQSAELINGEIKISWELPGWLSDRAHLNDGDGTVPQVSATPVQMGDQEILSRVDYIAEKHGALQVQPDILLNLLYRLQSVQSASIQDVRGSLTSVTPRSQQNIKGISLSLEDVYLANEPVMMHAKVTGTNAFNSLQAKIVLISGDGQTITENLTEENNLWKTAIDNLKPGLYRVEVQTDNEGEDAPSKLNSLFEVMDLSEN